MSAPMFIATCTLLEQLPQRTNAAVGNKRNAIARANQMRSQTSKCGRVRHGVTNGPTQPLSRYFEECDERSAIPTFYALESHYHVRDRSSEWNGGNLIG